MKKNCIFLTLILSTVLIVVSCQDKRDIKKSESSSKHKPLTMNDVKSNAFKTSTEALKLQKNFHDIAQETLLAVVDIRAEREVKKSIAPNPFDFFSEDFFDKHQDITKKVNSLGSGFIISKDGYIITNNHVIEGANNITVHLANKDEYSAKVIGQDRITDIAVIKINPNKAVPTLQLGDSADIQVGNFALAVGNPFGFSGSFTFGVISAKGRTQGNIDRNAVFKHFIQTDAAINQGNSGGPLLNIKGQVIGINTAIYSNSGKGSVGIGFAIPIDIAKNVVKQLIAKGSVDRGYIGVLIENLDISIAKYYKLENKEGVLINDVQPNGPADKAGVKAGDIILYVNDEKVRNTTELIKRISEVLPGKQAKLVLLRRGEKKELLLAVGKRPESITWMDGNRFQGKKGNKSSWLGLSFGLVKDYKNVLNLKGNRGVVITGVKKGSPAAKASKPFHKGDIVESINNLAVKNLGSIERILKEEKGKKSYLFYIIRKGKRLFSVVVTK